MKYVINIEPKPQSRPRFTSRGGGRAYEKKDMTAWKKNVRYQTLKQRPERLENCPVSIQTYFYIYPPKRILNVKKNRQALEDEIMPCYKKSDIDNLFKAVTDSLNGILYKDDGQIADMHAKKVYSLKPRIEIIIEKLEVQNVHDS